MLVGRYQGQVSAALVLGGVDVKGPHLFTVYPHGSTDALPYATMGSGSLNAMAVFESEYRCVPFDFEYRSMCSHAVYSRVVNAAGESPEFKS